MDYGRFHLRFGWWSLLVFTALGLALEGLHGFKIGAYLNVSNETRRLMWTLAHAHGTLLSLVHIAFGLNLRVVPDMRPGNQRLVSTSLIGASLLLPGGFFVGGIVFYGGDPGPGAILMIPLGAALMLVAVFLIARTTAAVGPFEDSPRKATPGTPGTSKSRR